MKTPKEWAEWTKENQNKSWVTFIREVQADAIEAGAKVCINLEDEMSALELAALTRNPPPA